VVRVNCCYGTSLGEHGTNEKKKTKKKKMNAFCLNAGKNILDCQKLSYIPQFLLA